MLTGMVECVGRPKQNGARSVIMGCAGFSAFAPDLKRATGAMIIDPTIAAVALAISDAASEVVWNLADASSARHFSSSPDVNAVVA